MKKTSPCIEKAIKDVTGFEELYSLMECSIIISGKSESTLMNDARCLATMALHCNLNSV